MVPGARNGKFRNLRTLDNGRGVSKGLNKKLIKQKSRQERSELEGGKCREIAVWKAKSRVNVFFWGVR